MAASMIERVRSPERQRRLDIDEAAEILGVTRRTMYAYRAANYGPRSVRWAGPFWYSADDCYRFMAEVEAATAKGSGL